jgi:uncharacterized membrane protein YtjA (UPF0391 family)
MLRAAIAFFLIGLIAVILGANNVAGLSLDLGKLLLTIFVILAFATFAMNLVTGRKTKTLV